MLPAHPEPGPPWTTSAGLPSGIAADLPVDEVAVAHVEHPVVVRLDRRVRIAEQAATLLDRAHPAAYARPMKVLYLVTTGAGDPTRASLPFHIAANGSVVEGQECAIALAGDGTELVARETQGKSKVSAFRRCKSCCRSSSTTAFRSTSERVAPSPVGRPTQTWSG